MLIRTSIEAGRVDLVPLHAMLVRSGLCDPASLKAQGLNWLTVLDEDCREAAVISADQHLTAFSVPQQVVQVVVMLAPADGLKAAIALDV